MLEKIAVGADSVNAARSMMMALGCVQAKACNTNHCPTGIATQDPKRAKAVDVDEKSVRVKNFHHGTVEAFLELCGAMGYSNPCDLSPSDLYSRIEGGMKSFDEIYEPMVDKQLFSDTAPDSYRGDWLKASAASF